MGPGPSSVSPNVYKALSTYTVGHLDKRFLDIMDDVKRMLRKLLKTDNELTLPVSGTGTAAMESSTSRPLHLSAGPGFPWFHVPQAGASRRRLRPRRGREGPDVPDGVRAAHRRPGRRRGAPRTGEHRRCA